MAKILFALEDYDDNLSYIAGVIMGDGSLHEYLNKNRKGTMRTTPCHTVCLGNTDLDFVNEFATRISYLIGPGTAKIKKNQYSYKPIYHYSRHSHWLYSLFNREPKEIMSDVHSPLHFLKGLFDSEGCVSFHRKNNRLHKALSISTSDISIKEIVQQILEQNGIRYNISAQKSRKQKMKDGHWLIPKNPYVFQVVIGTKYSIERFAEIMPSLIPRKQIKLEQLLKEMKTLGGIDPETGQRIMSITTRKKMSEARTAYWERKHKHG
jgi:intein/homing endonuclease